MAYYGGEEQRKKDAYEKQLKKMLPKRGFDQLGREIDPRSGKVLSTEELLDDLLSDPLQELYDLAEDMLPKPPLQDDTPPHTGSPMGDAAGHPVIKRRNEIDSLIAQGMDPMAAHTALHGEVDTSNTASKGALAGTLGRLQDENLRRGVKIEYDKGSILAKDAELEAKMDAVTFDDLRTPMNQQVPDDEQPMPGGVKEESDFDYNDDVAYLQKFGRA